MKYKVGTYKDKIIVEGGENPENELMPHEMLYPAAKEKVFKLTPDNVLGLYTSSTSIDLGTDGRTLVLLIPNSPVHGIIKDAFQEIYSMSTTWKLCIRSNDFMVEIEALGILQIQTGKKWAVYIEKEENEFGGQRDEYRHNENIKGYIVNLKE